MFDKTDEVHHINTHLLTHTHFQYVSVDGGGSVGCVVVLVVEVVEMML